MAMSERQKVFAWWIGWLRRISIVGSFGLLAWSGYALVKFKPEKIQVDLQQHKSSPAPNADSAMAAYANAPSRNPPSPPVVSKAE